MNMIVAADKKNGIGYQGKLLVTIPFDQQAVSEGNDRKRSLSWDEKLWRAFQADVCLKDAQTLY